MNSLWDFLDQEQPPDIIYHYTTQDGFLGIIKSESLWTTDILCLNDASEFKLAFGLGSELLGADDNENEYSIAKNFIEQIGADLSFNFNAFVCSFSEKGDLLSQWRAYGKKQVVCLLVFVVVDY